ncbi:O-methyltransferase [Alkalibacter saccharofermentans]|uniref:tRNA 5-hydroxyuridine methyltransferase n=1 Tax=Alkalibacter saccharofermentans DSM 14828 TaxID=1120975 RepID=A0A1M4S7V8_9FIRM|nr:O-methyltransferase [Alkalibacter saccharofermentans]SHE28289.1 caffeoyl-CoA O-methyltransferase [Alkalibacter saccharofermentans DSM 14828]
MSKINHEYIETYIRGLLNNEDKLLLELEGYAEKNNVPIIHPEVRQLIGILLQTGGYEKILEIGTAIGYSALSFVKKNENITVDTIELNEDMVKLAGENIEKAGYDDRIKIIYGDASKVVPELEKKYDVIFLDGAKGHYIHMLEDCLRLLNPGGMIISDNVLFRGMVASDELVKRRKITIVKRMRKYLEALSDHPRLDTSIIPIGDGLAISRLVR